MIDRRSVIARAFFAAVLALASAAVASAGGARAEEVNLAKPPQEAYGNEPSPNVTTRPVIMINKASEADLLQHPQVGSLYAKKVIAGRPYDGPEDFKKRGGLPPENFDRVKDLLDF